MLLQVGNGEIVLPNRTISSFDPGGEGVGGLFLGLDVGDPSESGMGEISRSEKANREAVLVLRGNR
jgi:hypothetical protein